ncbi:hypothetical protein [Hyphomonas sp.]|uniref:hypothetical protein n=1 Tax=Hyphomonas sp. TaxID=87 RepID=UPI00391C062B
MGTRTETMVQPLLPGLRLPLVTGIDGDGPVVAESACEVIGFRDPKRRYLHAEVLIHQQADHQWIWAICYGAEESGGGYLPGPKWGKFAACREDALVFALDELTGRVRRGARATPFARKIIAWAQAKRDEVSA